MWTFLRNLLGPSHRSNKSAAACHRPGTSLQLEALEDRLTPTTLVGLSGIANLGNLTIFQPYTPFSVSGTTLNVYGTSGNDSFSFTHGASTNTVTLNGATYVVNPALIHNINFYGEWGSDTTTLTDTVSRASAVFNPHAATMTGSNYVVSVNNTTYNYAFGMGGDSASFNDSPGNDTFYAGGASAGMYDSGFTYLNSTTGFSFNNGYSGHGGQDTAQFFDTPANDIYYAGAGFAGMTDYNTFSNTATGFAITHGYSNQGGTDTAYLYDSNAAGISEGGNFIGFGANANLLGYNYNNTATGFSDVEAYSAGYDYYTLYAINYTVNFNGEWEQQ